MRRNRAISVRRRRVFFIPGHFPVPWDTYRDLYRRQAVLQAAACGYDVAIKAGMDEDGFGWRVASMMNGQPTRTQVEVLTWSDAVHPGRWTGPLETYRALARTVWIYIATGAIFRIAQVRRRPLLAAFYPVAALLAQAFIALALGWAMLRVVSRMGAELGVHDLVATGAGYLLALLIAVLTLCWFRDNDKRFLAYHLMHALAGSVRLRGAYPPELEQRLANFRTKISASMLSDADEVLVIGHSHGAHLAVSVMSDVLRSAGVAADGPVLSLLSLGQVAPMVSSLPNAARLRRDLQYVSQSHDVTWVDVTAPDDACCFVPCKPAQTARAPTVEIHAPLVTSAVFGKTVPLALRRPLCWPFFQRHFQYLCATDQTGGYDFLAISAGPLSLGARYGAKDASPPQTGIGTTAQGW